jgi:hypothetical protein
VRVKGDVVMDDQRSPWVSRGFVFGAALVGLVVVLAVVLVATRQGAPAHARAARGPGSGAVQTVTPVETGSECGLPAGSQTVPSSPPAVVSWGLVGSMAAPSSQSVGPGRIVGGFRRCFAHSPTGALFSAVNFWAAGTAYAPSRVYAQLAADTPSRARAVRFSAGDDSRLSDGGQVQLAGFEFNSYSPNDADLSIVLQSTGGQLVTIACTMLWQQGDWRYEIPPSGAPAAGQIQSLDGYVAWSDA